jgi:DsbC/DsbD-like thiol-disulfide interchange protein
MLYPISSVFPSVIQLTRNELPTLISVRIYWKRVGLCAHVCVPLQYYVETYSRTQFDREGTEVKWLTNGRPVIDYL